MTYESLESAGISKEKLKGTQTGVYMGVCFSDYHKIQTSEQQDIKPYVQVNNFSFLFFFYLFFFFKKKKRTNFY